MSHSENSHQAFRSQPKSKRPININDREIRSVVGHALVFCGGFFVNISYKLPRKFCTLSDK